MSCRFLAGVNLAAANVLAVLLRGAAAAQEGEETGDARSASLSSPVVFGVAVTCIAIFAVGGWFCGWCPKAKRRSAAPGVGKSRNADDKKSLLGSSESFVSDNTDNLQNKNSYGSNQQTGYQLHEDFEDGESLASGVSTLPSPHKPASASASQRNLLIVSGGSGGLDLSPSSTGSYIQGALAEKLVECVHTTKATNASGVSAAQLNATNMSGFANAAAECMPGDNEVLRLSTTPGAVGGGRRKPPIAVDRFQQLSAGSPDVSASSVTPQASPKVAPPPNTPATNPCLSQADSAAPPASAALGAPYSQTIALSSVATELTFEKEDTAKEPDSTPAASNLATTKEKKPTPTAEPTAEPEPKVAVVSVPATEAPQAAPEPQLELEREIACAPAQPIEITQDDIKPTEEVKAADEITLTKVKPTEEAKPVEDVQPAEAAMPAEDIQPAREEVQRTEAATPAKDEIKPMEEVGPSVEIQPVEGFKRTEDVTPTEEIKLADEIPQVEDIAPTKEVEPTEYVKPADEVLPVEEVKPTEEEVRPTEDVKPTDEVLPVEEEVKPTEDVKPDEVLPVEEVKPTEEEVKPTEEVKKDPEVPKTVEDVPASPKAVGSKPDMPVEDSAADIKNEEAKAEKKPATEEPTTPKVNKIKALQQELSTSAAPESPSTSSEKAPGVGKLSSTLRGMAVPLPGMPGMGPSPGKKMPSPSKAAESKSTEAPSESATAEKATPEKSPGVGKLSSKLRGMAIPMAGMPGAGPMLGKKSPAASGASESDANTSASASPSSGIKAKAAAMRGMPMMGFGMPPGGMAAIKKAKAEAAAAAEGAADGGSDAPEEAEAAPSVNIKDRIKAAKGMPMMGMMGMGGPPSRSQSFKEPKQESDGVTGDGPRRNTLNHPTRTRSFGPERRRPSRQLRKQGPENANSYYDFSKEIPDVDEEM